MPNKEKIKKVEILTDKFKNASALYFTKYTGMNVEQATLLRRQFADNSIEFLVSKNTLAKIACENAGFDKNLFNDFLSGQIAIAYANSDPTAPAGTRRYTTTHPGFRRRSSRGPSSRRHHAWHAFPLSAPRSASVSECPAGSQESGRGESGHARGRLPSKATRRKCLRR